MSPADPSRGAEPDAPRAEGPPMRHGPPGPGRRPFATLHADAAPVVQAPDGSSVRVLLALSGGSLATFMLQPGQVSAAVTHRSVEELWLVLAGRGEMWRRDATQEALTPLGPGLSLSVPLGTAFQFRCTGDEPLVAVAVTMPPWPGDGEAVVVDGPWIPMTG